MKTRWTEFIAAFDGECIALTAVLDGIDEPTFATITNCPPWSLRELVVHICFSACTLPPELATPPRRAVQITAADYYRRTERETDGYRQDNVARTQRVARQFPAGREATDAVAAAWADTRHRIACEPHSRMLPGPTGVMKDGKRVDTTAITVADFMITRLIALAAHAVDVALTIGRQPWTTDAAAAVVAPTLLELFGDDRVLQQMGWQPRDLLVAATGRRALSVDERRRLGDRADAFPLLS